MRVRVAKCMETLMWWEQLSVCIAPNCAHVLDLHVHMHGTCLRYAQLVAANALKKLIVSSWNHLTPQQQMDFRNYGEAN